MKSLTVLLSLASLFVNSFLFDYSFASDLKGYSMAQDSIIALSADSVIDIDLLLNDTTIFKEVKDSINNDTLVIDSIKVDSLLKSNVDTVLVNKSDTMVKKVVPQKPVVVIPKSVIELNKIYSDYRKYSEWAQERWDDIYLSLSEIDMKSDYYKFVVPLTYYSKSFDEASSIDSWFPRDILVNDSLRKASMLEIGMPHMQISSEVDRRINRQLLDFYVQYPQLVKKNETSLIGLDFMSSEDMTSAHREDNIISLIQNNAGFDQMSDSELLVLKPNFWSYGDIFSSHKTIFLKTGIKVVKVQNRLFPDLHGR